MNQTIGPRKKEEKRKKMKTVLKAHFKSRLKCDKRLRRLIIITTSLFFSELRERTLFGSVVAVTKILTPFVPR